MIYYFLKQFLLFETKMIYYWNKRLCLPKILRSLVNEIDNKISHVSSCPLLGANLNGLIIIGTSTVQQEVSQSESGAQCMS